MDWISEIDPETDLPERYLEVVSVIGLEATIKLASAFPSIPIYLARPDYIFKAVKIRYVKKHFNKSNHRKLARATGFSESYIYRIVSEQEGPKEVQPALF